MSTSMSVADSLPRDLGNGLLLRLSTHADGEALAEFNRWVHRDAGVVEPDEPVGEWTRELLSGQHPTFGEHDFTIVAERETGRIVSTLNLISQTWTYGGIPFGVGRVEAVGTAPEYRRRGLIRLQFDVVHRLSAERGEQVQAITGIPYYYRQFGYEMAMNLGGGREGYPSALPALKEGQTESFVLRPVVESDLDFVLELDRLTAQRSLVHAPRDARLWRFELFERRTNTVQRAEWRIVQTPAGQRGGLIGFSPFPWGGSRLGVLWFELAPGWSYVETAASVLRAMKTEGQALMAAKGKVLSGLEFGLGEQHPFYAANQERLPLVHAPYAWYLRVPDLPGFVRTIAPALEERLARSFAAGHSGELKLSFYRSGLRILLERGRCAVIEPWLPVASQDEGHAAFPGLTFLQLLFGYRTSLELRSAFADVWSASDETRGLLAALFPRQNSHFIPIS
jgi:hypothetical protein